MNLLTGELYLHFTWVGPPKLDNSDVNGPMAMSRAVADDHYTTHLIKFWCLDEHVPRYAGHFRGCRNVEVRGIQTFLRSFTGTFSRWWNWYGARETGAADTIRAIMAAASRAEASTRERVNGKNAWSLFLLYGWGGYVMDSGVWPSEARLTFPWERKMRAPASVERGEEIAIGHYRCGTRADWFGTTCSTTNTIVKLARLLARGAPNPTTVDTMFHFDVWALCSPQHDAGALRALEWYLHVWHELEGWRAHPPDEEFDDTAYRESCRYAIMGAVYNGLSHDGDRCVRPADDRFWRVANLNVSPCTVPALGIEKRYGGSHSAAKDSAVVIGEQKSS